MQEKPKEAEKDVLADVSFEIEDMGQWIILDNSYTTVENALHSKVEKRIQYHKMQDVPGQPGSYKVTQEQHGLDPKLNPLHKN